jgi:hypothetical protein
MKITRTFTKMRKNASFFALSGKFALLCDIALGVCAKRPMSG